MPPTVTTSTSSGTPTAIPIITTPTPSDGFNGEDFINNLGSDLAPLLTLFGEQVTKQFLSMSLGWADHILLAVGPLGIITTVVSAIRVSNITVLKAIIGRAREKLATAELELLSSTSYATSELWTDEGVVRQAGHAKILEMIVYEPKSTKKVSSQDQIELKAPSQVRIGDLSEAYHAGVLESADEGRSNMFTDVFGRLSFKSRKPSQVLARSRVSELQARIRDDPVRLAIEPPNLALNVHKALPTSYELWTFAIVGAALQLVAVAIPTAMTYYWRKPKGMNPVQDYACPTFLIGTCLLVLSIALCSYIIETTTVERSFIPKNDSDVKKIFWLQLRQNMGDQPFYAYKYTGLSLENMQDPGTSHGAGQNRPCGYLAIPVGKPEAHFAFELLSGFMDALWQTAKLKYNAEAENWSVESDGHDKEVDVDGIVDILMGTGLVHNEKDAQVLVYSSLARCTVWKDPPERDGSTSTAHQHSDPPLSAGFTTHNESPRRSQSRPTTAGTAQADENLQDDAATPSNPEHRPVSAPVIPICSVSEGLEAEDSLKAGAIASGASAYKPTPTASTSSPHASKAIQSPDDKGKQAASSHVSVDQ
ncbi:uncharacterized protein J4E84_010600 [Alternaria hordeiaustralica]|uniref:uncharacterized protein n=1 Tax=Alternaria hordeiaustralica TaxID=1187925 RepID=UPI0020C44A75|nr:uncharacterized protein J4E84_010600 [Alternaria hordeiaustralica]KAI4674362.1 hypothetical protein J4E84_010600 [Alternaria hordeiaustralica]